MRRHIRDSKEHIIGVVCGTKEECDKFESTWNEVKKKYGDAFAVLYIINHFEV